MRIMSWIMQDEKARKSSKGQWKTRCLPFLLNLSLNNKLLIKTCPNLPDPTSITSTLTMSALTNPKLWASCQSQRKSMLKPSTIRVRWSIMMSILETQTTWPEIISRKIMTISRNKLLWYLRDTRKSSVPTIKHFHQELKRSILKKKNNNNKNRTLK